MLAIPGSPLTVTLTASSIDTTLYVDGCDYTIETQKFQRKEYSNTFMMNLKESDGSEPIFIKNATGKPIQINFSCGNYSAREVATDDNNINNILRKFLIKRYTLKGAPTAPSALDQLYDVALDHARRLQAFEAYLDSFSLNLSYSYFNALKSGTFSYLTSTGLTLQGDELMDETHCLINSINYGILYTDPDNGIIVCKGWDMVVSCYDFQETAMLFK